MTLTLGTTEVQTAGGYVARFDVRDDTSDAPLVHGIIAEQEYAFDRLQGLSGWAIDIGAHIGIVTVALALDNPDLRVIAVEALPENVDLLRRNVARNGLSERVTIHAAAAGSEAEYKRGKPIGITYGWQSAVNQPDGYMHDNRYIGGMVGPNDTSETALCLPVSLDSLTRDMDEVALLKIDCEGCEWHFLTSPALAKVQRVIGEAHVGRHGTLADLRVLLADFEVTMDDSLVVATFEAVRR